MVIVPVIRFTDKVWQITPRIEWINVYAYVNVCVYELVLYLSLFPRGYSLLFFTEIQITGSQFVEKGDRIVLQCNATGEYYPPDEMDWFRNGERISSQRHRGVRISKQYSISKRTFTSVLVIDRANMHDDGTYVCRSSNMQITSTKVHVLNGKYFNSRLVISRTHTQKKCKYS